MVKTKKTTTYLGHFYRAMHLSAKRSIAIACRPSVCLYNIGRSGLRNTYASTLEILETNCKDD